MLNLTLIGRTVAIAREYKEGTRKGNNGDFQFKEVFVRVAVDRGYKVTKADGSKEKATDFFLVKFEGALAETFKNYASAMKDDGKGGQKLQSRHIAISGSLETYDRPREYNKVHAIALGDQTYNVQITDSLPDTGYVIVARSLEFLDSNPNAGQATATPAPTATVLGVAQPAPVAQPVAQPVATPVVDATGNECPI